MVYKPKGESSAESSFLKPLLHQQQFPAPGLFVAGKGKYI